MNVQRKDPITGRILPAPALPIGTRYGRWTVIGTVDGKGDRKSICRCDCGTERVVKNCAMRSGHSLSCGCWTRERRQEAKVTHGMHRRPEYTSWAQLKARCFNPRHKQFSLYGARGITVCDRWRDSFVNFFADMGPRPSKAHSIDRIDNNGNYEPGNCRWASMAEQNRNRRSTRFIEIDGERLTVTDWAIKSGVSRFVIYRRLDAGADPRTAVFTPLHEFSKHGEARA